MSTKVKLYTLENIFRKCSLVEFAFVFGSAKTGIILNGSDLDIAVYFSRKPKIMELASLRADIQVKTQFDNIDLITLNDASPILRFEALSGNRLFSRDRVKEAVFTSLSAREFEDETGMLNSVIIQYRKTLDKKL